MLCISVYLPAKLNPTQKQAKMFTISHWLTALPITFFFFKAGIAGDCLSGMPEGSKSLSETARGDLGGEKIHYFCLPAINLVF